MKMKTVDFEELSDLIKKHKQGDSFHTRVEFTLSGSEAVSLEILEKIFPGPREELIQSIISAGIQAHSDLVAPVLAMAKIHSAAIKEANREGKDGEG